MSRKDKQKELPTIKNTALDNSMKYLDDYEKKMLIIRANDKDRIKQLQTYIDNRPITRTSKTPTDHNYKHHTPITTLKDYKDRLYKLDNFDKIRNANHLLEKHGFEKIPEGNNANKNGGKRTNRKRTNRKTKRNHLYL